MRIHFAAAALHAVVVNLNINLASRELKYILEDSRSKLVFVDQGVGASLAEACEDLPLVFIDVDGSCSVPQAILAKGTSFDGLLSETGPLPVVDGASMEDTFHLYYTSGTTGTPKPVELRYDEWALFA
jgi:long-subunit acyl-CoA synthetase (AMP-forming)